MWYNALYYVKFINVISTKCSWHRILGKSKNKRNKIKLSVMHDFNQFL